MELYIKDKEQLNNLLHFRNKMQIITYNSYMPRIFEFCGPKPEDYKIFADMAHHNLVKRGLAIRNTKYIKNAMNAFSTDSSLVVKLAKNTIDKTKKNSAVIINCVELFVYDKFTQSKILKNIVNEAKQNKNFLFLLTPAKLNRYLDLAQHDIATIEFRQRK